MRARKKSQKKKINVPVQFKHTIFYGIDARTARTIIIIVMFHETRLSGRVHADDDGGGLPGVL